MKRVSILGLSLLLIALHASADLSFHKTGDGLFSFDTGIVRGVLQADSKSQGIPSLIHIETDTELAYGKSNPGILSYYRLFTKNKRWGDSARGLKKIAQVLDDGSLRVDWPSSDQQPFTMSACYRWQSPDTLDVETIVTSQKKLDSFEVFLSSYFNTHFKTWVYVKPTLHNPGKPFFLSTQVNPMVEGTYLAFPRDREAAQMIYDGRWDIEPHPVHFSVAKFFENPLCVKNDTERGITVVLMSRSDGCFAVEAPYDMTPPDGVAGHQSVYFSLFGDDLQPDQSVKTTTRLVIKHQPVDPSLSRGGTWNLALEEWERFVEEN